MLLLRLTSPCDIVAPCHMLPQTFADDIGVLADTEECDVLVDDIGYLLE